MIEKELILQAVDNYDAYTINQKKTLKMLINIAIDGIAIISVESLSKLTGLSRGITYYNLSFFIQEGVIEKNGRSKILSRFRLIESKLDYFVKLHQNRLNYINNQN